MALGFPRYTWILGSVGQGIRPKYCEKTGRSLLGYMHARKKQRSHHEAAVSRQLVDTEFHHRNKLFEQATKAYKSGEKVLAQQLSAKGQKHAQKAEALAHQEMQQVFWANNRGRNLVHEVDLHGLRAFEALSVLASLLPRANDPYRVITGLGKGSAKQAVLNHAVIEFCQSRGHLFDFDGHNRGVLVLRRLRPGTI